MKIFKSLLNYANDYCENNDAEITDVWPQIFWIYFFTNKIKELDSLVTSNEESKMEALLATQIQKQLYFTNTQELERQYEPAIKKYNSLEEKFNQLMNEHKLLQKQYNKMLEENNKLQERIKILETVDSAQVEVIEETITTEQQLELLASVNIAIVGGDIKWQQTLSKLLPSLDLYAIDDLNKDFSKLENLSIFVNSEVNKHSLFYKVQNMLEQSTTPLDYCSTYTNIDLTIDTFYKKCKSKEII
ncbi:hypothetical protein JFL43_20845 [Viridibacillus sp. YIM B01967]|uniref:Uncharacterized protein n=1 Tax=Viridibacillus soli TaxID=2798301 RepID=A0ABS1HCR4_9BACL|nr:hypothetical protein [Viridibacillus soli]MBK3497228.1 hypothetical protein [Viridibacillus soli]